MKRYWYKKHSQKRLKRTYNLLAYFILCFILIFFSNSNLTTYYMSSIKEDNWFNQDLNPKTSAPPVISILYPDNYTLFGTTAPNYNLTITSGIGNYSWYQFLETGENSVPKALEGVLNENITDIFDQTLWDNLDNGTVTIRFYVNDSLGDIGQVDAIIRIDIIDPTINVISPTGGFFNSTSPKFTVEISDPNLDKMWYTLNTDTTKYPFQDNGTIDQSAWESLPDGPVDINFFANDSVGNENSNSVQVTKDSVNPAPPIGFSADPSSWTNINNFDVTWTNPSDTSGIVGAYYKLDSAPTFNTDGTYVAGSNIESITGITVSSNGTHTIYVWLRDTVGNIDYNNYNSSLLYLDGEDPLAPSLLIATPSSWTNIDSFDLTWTNPSDISGIVGAYYSLDYAPTSDTDGTYVTGVDIESISGISVSTDGTHTVYVWLNDTAGNIDYNNYNMTQLFLDTEHPSSAIELNATPSSWTNINSFNLSWINPSDTSGIIGAYYSIDTAPTSDTDGIYVEGDNIESIVGITASSEGTHTAYVWLVDAAGNINYSTYVTTQFYLDTSDPLIPPGLIAIPSSWTNVNSFNVSWTNPTDLSGIVGAYYKLDSAPTSNTDGTYVVGADIETITGITVNSNGTHTIYVWLVDAAGNINYNNYNTTLLYLDAIKPTIDDSQDGDELWRNAGGTTYNVDFFDPSPSSTLDYAQYKITSAQGQGGTILVDWAYIFTDHDSSSYTLDWSIDFDACQEGTNWVSVRVFDDAGNFNESNDIFYVKKDTLSPALLINSPNDGSIWNSPPDIYLSATDLNLDSVWYTVGGTKILLTNGVSEPLNYTIWSNLSGEQEFTIYYYANDTVGNVNNTYSHTLYKDVLAPRMTIHKPSNLTYYDDRPPINVTAIDPNFASLTYTVVGYSPTNIWLNNNTEELLDENIWNQLPQGEFQLTFSAFDDLGNGNEVSYTLYKDTIGPHIIINSPNNLTYWNSAPYINVSAYDPNFQDVWYRVGTTNVSLTNNLEEMLNLTIWNSLFEGAFYVEIFANDTFGHLNDSYTLMLYKDTIAPHLTILSPTNNTYYYEPPDIHIIATDLDLDKIWYKIGTTEIEIPNNSPTPLNSSLWNNLGQGAFIVEIFANDTLNQLNDSYSLMLYKDTLPPVVIINSPINGTIWNTPPPINVSAIDPNLDDIWYRVGGFQDILLNNTEELLDNGVWNSLGNGPFEIYIWATDEINEHSHISGNYILTLYKDTQAPEVIINTPADGSYWNAPPTLNVMAIDSSLDTIWYQAGSENFTLTNNTDQMFDLDVWNNLLEEAFVIRFFANDTFGYLNDLEQITLFKDITIPDVNPYLPNNNTYYSVAPDIQIYVNDVNFDSVWYTVGVDKRILAEGVSEPLDATIWNNLDQGEFMINIFANDTAGNINNTYFFILYKDTLPPNVYVTSPLNESYWSDYPIIHVIAYDPNFKNTSYKIGDMMYPQIIPNDTDYEVPWSVWLPILDGPVLLEIFAEDVFGQINDSIKLTIYKDTSPPVINVMSPQHNEQRGPIAPDYEISVTDGNLEETWYQLIGTTINSSLYFIPVISGVSFSGMINQSAWDLFADGSLTIRFSANDSLNNINYFDRIVRKNTVDPIIWFDSPNPYELFGQQSPNVKIDKSGIEIDTTWYTLNNLNFTFSELNITLDQNAWNAIGNGTVLIKFYINDTAGNLGYNDLFLRKDIIIPIVYINLPYNNTMCRRAPYINITAVDPNLDKIWYKTNGEIRYLLNSISQTLESTIWDNIPEGIFTIEIFANDTVGNLNDLYKLYLEKDSILPNITIISPSENLNVGRDSPFFEISVFDIHLDSTWYIIEDINEKVLFTGDYGKIDESMWQNLWDNLTHGDIITLIFYANDTVGNIGQARVNLVKYTGEPFDFFKILTGPMGFYLTIITFGAMIPASTVLVKTKYYKTLEKSKKSKVRKFLTLTFFTLALVILYYLL